MPNVFRNRESTEHAYNTSRIKDGQIVMGVHPRNSEDAKYFEDNWRTNKGEEIHS